MIDRPEDALLVHYDQMLGRFGDTAQGAHWPNERDRQLRFDVMLDLLEARPATPVVLVDLACGTGELLSRLRARGMAHVEYVGIDRSAKALALARAKFPEARFHELDVNAPDADLALLDCDYLVANGLFTFKHTMSHESMRDFVHSTIRRAWPHVRRGMAFNVMSKIVDWEREDLYHASMDEMATLLHELAGRRVRLRADYGLYEFTCYAWRGDAIGSDDAVPAAGPLPSSPAGNVPVLRPLLPRAEQLLPYLRRIDATRIYSNYGPLVLELEGRLTRALSLPPGSVATAGTGTAGLMGAILALAGEATPERPLALMPSYTFVAPAVAAQRCGYQPWLADVALDDWMLHPEALQAHPQLARIGLVMPVASYGRPVPHAPWQEFSERTGIPVVIDAAASFEAVSAEPARYLGALPVVLSLHATKSLATGEGGCVATSDLELATRVVRALNFGFQFSRDSLAPSLNGKLSEYHAAVGLAELDAWQSKQQAFASVVASYRRQAEALGIIDQLVTAPAISSCYVLLRCEDSSQSARVQAALRTHGVEFRLWYGQGVHAQSWFASSARDPLPVTEALAPCLLGLPMAADLGDADIGRVLRAVAAGLGGKGSAD
jgi:dTDP-4-amino-4,6-dideoxygalactose transaminase/SAM-dependent methyltransferase